MSQTIPVQVSLYGLEALYKTCYTFLDRVYIRLEGDPQGTVNVHLKAKEETSPAAFEAVCGEFGNELIHQALRMRVTHANQKIRDYIVTRALASAEGVSLESNGQDPQKPQPVLDEELEKEIEKLLAEVEKGGEDDPLKIAVPWEQKHPGPAEKQADQPEEAKDNAPKI